MRRTFILFSALALVLFAFRANGQEKVRVEKDLLGEKAIPAENEKMLQHYMETTVGLVTALNPVLGYEKATELASEAYKTNKGILEIIREKKILSEAQVKELLDPVKLTGLDQSKYVKE
jgi:aspartate ammonia-lyase